MGKLIVNTFMTLDGVMQAPGGEDEDTTGNFKYGGWVFYHWDDMMGQIMDEFIARPFSLLLGRKTYDIFASYWPNQEGPTADKFNPAKKYVVSHTLNKPSWNNSVLIKDNAAKEIEKIKNDDPNELHVYGSGSLVKTLVNNNLVDLFQVWIFPLTVGKGKQLFGEGTNAFSFRLIDVKNTGSGVIIAFYEPSGNLRTGNVGPE